MQLNKDFIKNLTIPFDAAMPHGGYAEIQRKNGLSPTVPAKILAGNWNNQPIVKDGLKIIVREHTVLGKFLQQFPPTLIADIKKELDPMPQTT